MSNPLANLCRQLGLEPQTIARVLACSPARVAAILSEQPPEPLASYLKLLAGLGVKLRLVADSPLRLWFDLGAIDALHVRPGFRAALGLCPLPASRSGLRHLIKRLRRKGLSYSEMTETLEKNFIPTITGVPHWRRSTIGQHLNLRISGRDGELPLGMTDEFRSAFRDYAIRHLLVAMCPFDPFGSVRHQFQSRQDGGTLYVETAQPLPAALRRWVGAAVAQLNWFKPREWGEGERHGPPQERSSAAAFDQSQPAHCLDDLPGPPGGGNQAGEGVGANRGTPGAGSLGELPEESGVSGGVAVPAQAGV